jgi:hypothetical protein
VAWTPRARLKKGGSTGAVQKRFSTSAGKIRTISAAEEHPDVGVDWLIVGRKKRRSRSEHYQIISAKFYRKKSSHYKQEADQPHYNKT